jgi:cofilin
MSMVNVKATPETLEKFNTMKLGKKHAYIIFTIDGSNIIVEKEALKADVGDDYLEKYIAEVKQSGQPRFSVVDWNHKLCFVAWVPDTSKAQSKMKFATCKEGFVQELVGVQIKLQATDDSELSTEAIMEKTKSNV